MDSIAKRPRTRLSPQKRKLQLMEIALEVFARRGIGRGGHADIAEIAQVSVATVFNYFPTREDLVDDVLTHVVRQFSNFLTENIDLDIHAKENLRNLTTSMITLVAEDCHWLKVWFEWSASTRDEVWPLFVSSNRTNQLLVQNMFAKAIERGEVCDQHSPEDLANLFQGICYSLFVQANRAKNKDELEKLVQSYLDMLCIYKHQ
ncbi:MULTISPECIES: LuxR/HapR/OpaR family quorum-sensing transcriptional regulator [Vibrio]|uniref:Putative TetR family transcriptional regulator n=1 Tax=Vibrio proteolyticus NBRC 13287 TaxID=1219065 RepID=U3A359_VIBPR|nr:MULTISPECIES: LuxR/HapR/OpaR family quorum-sensing transcriptional regulator [Vibrio]NAW59110.1 TetR family transcriptional regulator [Vibrio sp. V36_P2S2PM302]NAX20266.1 TetR family transcriptional regulator [Vibrio sp. V39_P1S14PM300]NAX24460.1 TetR family transcriptional regulator [Vibrio sp. V38_P2S17PM301]NAX30844.1 TetR family transcriptional regulator [Vibrio sp. V37_P2S8PM304]GAD67772.1 putative TetR family transcriptional regulator [Vibrio proteolyticus NBRC 13287]